MASICFTVSEKKQSSVVKVKARKRGYYVKRNGTKYWLVFTEILLNSICYSVEEIAVEKNSGVLSNKGCTFTETDDHNESDSGRRKTIATGSIPY